MKRDAYCVMCEGIAYWAICDLQLDSAARAKKGSRGEETLV
jgi:hypothetical protein